MSEISHLLSRLPEEEKIILQLHLVQGKSFSEIAKLLLVDEKVVHSVYLLAKKHLMELLIEK
jgi:DNA-directed RNA polymerase specialized sigma24 family protein